MPQNAGEVRFAAQSLYQNAPNQSQNIYRTGQPMLRAVSQSASINMVMDEFLEGFMDDGRMSVVRRFFCLFVTFDLFFISLLWLICILIHGMDIYDALNEQILHYDVHSSLFDVVMAAVMRFSLLIFFYALLSVNHWFVIALSTAGSCSFLIYKVFVFNWVDHKEPIFQVLLIIISFVLAWGETWFLDCRVIPKEKHARNYTTAVQRAGGFEQQRQPPLVAYHDESQELATSTFYSPFETIHNSDEEDEDDGQDTEWSRMGRACVVRAAKLLESDAWQSVRMTDAGDMIQFIQQPNIGKVWRVTAVLDFPPKLLLEHLFYKIEDIHTWNSTILESNILHTIDKRTDITYQVTARAGIIKSRDFVNLRCWHLCRNGEIIDTNNDQPPTFAWPSPNSSPIARSYTSPPASMPVSTTASVTVHRSATSSSTERLIDLSDAGDEPSTPNSYKSPPIQIVNDQAASPNDSEQFGSALRTGLGKSLGASGFYDPDVHSNGDEELEFADAEGDDEVVANAVNDPAVSVKDDDVVQQASATVSVKDAKQLAGNVYVSSAISVPYDRMPTEPKYVRGDNKLSCWGMRVIDGKPDSCIFEWLMCVDLKGYFHTSMLNKVYPIVIQDYMLALRKHCDSLKAAHAKEKMQQRRRTTQQHKS